MHIAFVSHLDPNDPRSYSGTTAHMLRALRKAGVEITLIGPLREPLKPYFNVKHAFHKFVLRRSYARDREPAVLRSYARQVKAQLGGAQVVLSPGGIAVAELECAQPIVLWGDATFAGMVGFYWKNLSRRSVRNGLAMERRALQRCRLGIFSSQWAAESAVRGCGADAAKVRMIEYGANLPDGIEPCDGEAAKMIAGRAQGRCNLLFVGVEWERKGAAFAIEVARELNYLGLPTTLQMIGCAIPPGVVLPDFVQSVGFVDKNSPPWREKIRALFGGSHFLILPSRAEACAMVLAEGCAFGLPSLATDVGGIPTAVRDGINGMLFSLDAPAGRWAQQVRRTLDEPDEYRALCDGALREYRSRLNWDVATQRLLTLLQTIV